MRLALPLSALAATALFAASASARYDAMGADGVRYQIDRSAAGLEVRLSGAGIDRPDQAVFVLLGTRGAGGSPLVPFEQGREGSTVWLPFSADLLLAAKQSAGGADQWIRRWDKDRWGAPQPAGEAFSVEAQPAQLLLKIPEKNLGKGDVALAVYLKDLAPDNGWGRLYGALDAGAASGTGEKVVRHFLVVSPGSQGGKIRAEGRAAGKPKIYQLLPRLFGNTNATRKPNGTLAENGSGKFRDLDDRALEELKKMGITHLWLTGVIQQATATDYAALGEPADDPDLLKGLAGSPYAIKDYFDVCPDYAEDPARRLEEFTSLLGRIHAHGMKALVDLVPNHVARSYASTVKPALSFGAKDDRGKFFAPNNNFFYLVGEPGPPLRLPTVDSEGRPTSPTVKASGREGDGLYDGEKEFGRATGNNRVSWAPSQDDWYETVKLNYGFDFTDPAKAARAYPRAGSPDTAVPDTWKKMDEIISYWQSLGVDGFRADMAHMVPPEFWRWAVARAKERKPGAFFIAEAYDDDPAKVPASDEKELQATRGNAMLALLGAGFDAVYDDPAYDAVKAVYEKGASANDIDKALGAPFFFDNALRYAENHDEVRLAAPTQWGGVGMDVGRPVSALLFGLSRGPVMVYHGQEVGEPASGAEGFGGDDARTSIFDYWSMPEFAKWANGGKYDGAELGDAQRALRDFYRRLLGALDSPAFRDGDFFPLNPGNATNPRYGGGADSPAGRRVYSYLRYDPSSKNRVLVVVNLNPKEALPDLRVRLDRRAMRFLGWDAIAGSKTVPVMARDILGEVPGELAEIRSTPAEMEEPGLPVGGLGPLRAAYYQLDSASP